MNVYESIMQGLNEALEYEKGNLKAKKTKCTINPAPKFNAQEIKNIRTQLDMTQSTFAAVLSVSPKTVEAWEAGINTPIGSARRMLSILQTDPSLLVKCNIISE